MKSFLISIVLCYIPYVLFAQKAEKQISFARENKPYSYYVDQANLWWQELEKDKSSENNWYNYYRACRSSQGKNDWKEVPFKDIPSLEVTKDIVKQLEKYIPNPFTHYFIVGTIGGVNPSAGGSLLKAYNINPTFEGIHSNMVTYSQSIDDSDLRKKVNKEWFKLNELSPGLLAYGYNVLMSLDSNSVLLTQHDNDSYPIWMLQDVLGIREDIKVINIDFIIVDNYRDMVFKDLKLAPLNLKSKSINDYYQNWSDIVCHFLDHYDSSKPLALGLTISPELYQSYQGQLTLEGLSLKRAKNADIKINLDLFENVFLFDNLKVSLLNDSNQKNINEINLNYLKLFKPLYDYYYENGNDAQIRKVRELSKLTAIKSGSSDVLKQVNKDFN